MRAEIRGPDLLPEDVVVYSFGQLAIALHRGKFLALGVSVGDTPGAMVMLRVGDEVCPNTSKTMKMGVRKRKERIDARKAK